MPQLTKGAESHQELAGCVSPERTPVGYPSSSLGHNILGKVTGFQRSWCAGLIFVTAFDK
jgi:hypothetical protein